MERVRHLEGRVAVVTGAGRGIGRAHALRLASHGAAVVVNDLGVGVDGIGGHPGSEGPTPAIDVVAEILAAGGKAVADHGDVASFAGSAAIVDHALDAFGRIDVVVNNAGIAADVAIDDMTEELLLRLIGVHYVGTIGMCRAAVAHMRTQGYGRIVTTVSEAALDSRFSGGIAYGGAKGAVWAATLSMARQLAGTGITVNGISPGARTRMNDALFAGHEPELDLHPDHVARVVAALVGEGAGHVNGHVIHAAAGAIRRYEVSRTATAPVLEWLSDELATLT